MEYYVKEVIFTVILGIDPGYAIVGYGIINYEKNRFSVIDYGAVTTEAKTPFNKRLAIIYNSLNELIIKYKPEAMAIEKLFYNTNAKTVIDVAQARGVIMLAAENNGIQAFEYTPLQVKQSVVGYGRAEKKQVQEMTRVILNLEKIPKPDDTADALAMAICHAHSSGSLMSLLKK
ncbi:MAG: crossover junction endodeoxyribonuclease RuvC [Clostridiales bacterium]|nr:crossover junction endodeoxyribonuclease RuvC [Clostridia bacterium]MCR4564226.1 crossover junction endodeoxyribonuclease RuvC [Clostridiales bacterium]